MQLLQLLSVTFASKILLVDGKLHNNKTDNQVKKGRIFSLFSIVQFPNDECTSTDTTYPCGLCVTSSECSSGSGTVFGTCASGFGTCCVFKVSATKSEVTKNLTYITNPGFPSAYATDVAGTTYTINKVNSDVCRIKLTYEKFQTTGPEVIIITTDGQCITDRLELTTTAAAIAPTVGDPGAYGDYPYLCGILDGQHSYLDVGCALDATTGVCTDDTATLKFTLANSNTYKIKVTQYSCQDQYVKDQAGCFQYFTGITGTVKSYNYADSTSPMHLAAQNYKACVRQEEGMCCIEWKAADWAVNAATCADADNRCVTAEKCGDDYVLIPDGANPGTDPTTFDRYCGVALHAGGTPAVNEKVISCTLPFTLGFVSEKTSNEGTAAGKRGFSVSYTQSTC